MNKSVMGGMAVAAVLLAGCTTTVDDRIQTMQNENARLARELSDAQADNLRLSQENDGLRKEKDYQTKRAEVLDREKAARVAEVHKLRGGVQEFSDQVVSNLRKLYEETVPVDFLGSELCPRSQTNQMSASLLVDMAHVFTSSGTLVGGRAFITGPLAEGISPQVQYCILRRDEQGQLKVQWMSNAVSATEAGYQDWRFDFPFQVYPGDVFAVYSVGSVTIPFDDADTGNVLVVPGEFQTGAVVALPNAGLRNKRAYSFGVTGYFNGR